MVKNAWLVVIITELAIKEKIIRLIKSLGTKGYTVYQGVTGEGDRGVRSGSGGIGMFGDNVRIETIVSSEEEADTIMREVNEKYFKNFAGIVYASDVRVIRVNKFLSSRK
ncbi:MAG: transcriptional regulator [Spirochaetota bacterium]|jgi:PII-like signaling protein